MHYGRNPIFVVAMGLLLGTIAILLFLQFESGPSESTGLSALTIENAPATPEIRSDRQPLALREEVLGKHEQAQHPTPDPSESPDSTLEFELASQRAKRLGRQLDGRSFQEACWVFNPGEPSHDVAADLRYNPLRVALSAEDLTQLESVKLATHRKLEKIRSALDEIEKAAARRAETEGAAEHLSMSADGRVDLKQSQPRHDDEVVRTVVSGTSKAYCVRFSPGVNAERDALLVEGTNAIQSGEEQLIAFFAERARSRPITPPTDRR
jgi:hypothetical protein